MKLLGHPYSHNSRKVHWALLEIDTPFTYEVIDLMTGAQKAPEFLTMNPNGRVPVLEDGDAHLFESNAILLHLAHRFPDSCLGLADTASAAKVLQWVLWQTADLAAALLNPWLMTFYASLGEAFDEGEHARQVEATQAPLDILEGSLQGADFMAGDFSVADIAVAESIGLCEGARVSLEGRPAIMAWFERLSTRPGFQASRPQG